MGFVYTMMLTNTKYAVPILLYGILCVEYNVAVMAE